MTTITIRDAEPADMAVLSAVFRRSSLSVDADRAHLLAHPETLDLAGHRGLRGPDASRGRERPDHRFRDLAPRRGCA